ncbi:MAG: hypothetical protein U9O95_01200 [Candidatus Marinimicrobia bacterium]|nr:hypothetical protein [Candidatus Neomarinimicrobiota bacterium]
MKNKPLLIFRIFAVAISIFSLSYRLFLNPIHGHGFKNLIFQMGFFSMQSALYIGIIFIFLLINQLRGKENKWPYPSFRGAALLYGIITGTIFGAFFAGSFNAHGLNLIVLYINHVLLTILILIDNFISIPPKSYKFDLLIYWMIYPFYYLVFTIFESYVLNVNRYYFMIVNEINASFYPYIIFLMALMFILCGALIIFVNNIYRGSISNAELDEVIQENKK